MHRLLLPDIVQDAQKPSNQRLVVHTPLSTTHQLPKLAQQLVPQGFHSIGENSKVELRSRAEQLAARPPVMAKTRPPPAAAIAT